MPQVEGLRTQLVALQGEGQISEFTYVSKDDALNELQGRLKDPSDPGGAPQQPAAGEVQHQADRPGEGAGIIDRISDSPAIDPELGISYGKETADKLLSVAASSSGRVSGSSRSCWWRRSC